LIVSINGCFLFFNNLEEVVKNLSVETGACDDVLGTTGG
jgi:hypothetical protein